MGYIKNIYGSNSLGRVTELFFKGWKNKLFASGAVCLGLFVLPVVFFPQLEQAFVQGKVLTFKFVVLLMILAVCVRVLAIKRLTLNKFWEHGVFRVLFLLFCVVTLSTAFSPVPIMATYGSYVRGGGFLVILFLFGWFLLNASFLSRDLVKKGLYASFLAGCVVAFYAVLQKFGVELFFGNYDREIFEGRVFSLLGNPSFLGQFLVLEFFVGLYLLISCKGWFWRVVFGVLLVNILAGLVFSQSRASMLGLGVGGVLLAMKYLQNNRKLLVKMAVLLVLAVFAVVLLLPMIDAQRFSFSKVGLRSLNSRFTIWESSIELIKKRPLLGYGWETFSVFFHDTVKKDFYLLEEDLDTLADRVHNEFLEFTYSSGIFAGILYLLLIGCLVRIFFVKRDWLEIFVVLALLVNFVQDQFLFVDIGIAALVGFLLAAAVALDVESKELRFKAKPYWILWVLALVILIFNFTIYRPYLAFKAYSKSEELKPFSYDAAVGSLKNATYYAPQYAQFWYDLMFLDESSVPRALNHLKQIEGESGEVLAWRANYYSEKDPALAYGLFKQLLRRNPEHPNWTRAYADSLYLNGRMGEALTMYKRYLELIPDFWKWGDLASRPLDEQKSYRVFFKHNPDVWKTVKRVAELKGERGW